MTRKLKPAAIIIARGEHSPSGPRDYLYQLRAGLRGMGRLLAQEAVSYSETRSLAIARLFDEAHQQGYEILNWKDPRP